MKVCTVCKQEKPFDQFYKRTAKYYRSDCKACANERAKNWSQTNREKRREIVRRSDKKYRNRKVENTVTHQIKYPSRYLLHAARDRARKRGIPFSLTEFDIVIPEVCPIFGTPFIRGTNYAASLDRKDPSLGYVPGNVQVISLKANVMKNNASPEELKQFAQWIIFNG